MVVSVLGVLALAGAACLQATPGDDASGAKAAAQTAPEAVSLLGGPLHAMGPGPQRDKLERQLAAAKRDFDADPNDVSKRIWLARRLGYLWRMNESVAVLDEGIRQHPDDPRLYRHRGHRYIHVRQFDRAAADFEKAAELIRGRPDDIEPDGMPNARNIPLTTLGFNVWYHLGLSRYLLGDFEAALAAFRETMNYARGYDDNVVAVSDWLYMILRRLGRDAEATAVLEPIRPDMDIIENTAYYRRLLMYKGLIEPDALLDLDAASDLDLATLGYGLGNWYLYGGDAAKAEAVFERVIAGSNWPAFGYIAAEAELARMRGRRAAGFSPRGPVGVKSATNRAR